MSYGLLNLSDIKMPEDNRATLDDKAIPMEPIKERLRNLRQHLPDQPNIVYDFATYLADRLNPELVPMGFQLETELTIYDLQRGVSGYPLKPVPDSLAGYPPQMYALLRMSVPEIAEASCPQNFANAVKAVFEQFNAEIAKKR